MAKAVVRLIVVGVCVGLSPPVVLRTNLPQLSYIFTTTFTVTKCTTCTSFSKFTTSSTQLTASADMTAKTYQILCRNIETCASSLLASYVALNNPTEENIAKAIACSVIPATDYSERITNVDSLGILINGEKLIKEVIKEIEHK